MSDQKPSAVRRLVSFSAGAAFGVAVGLSSLMLLASSVDPGKLRTWNVLVGLAFILASAVFGVVATVGLRYAANRLLRKFPPAVGVLCGGMLMAALVPVLWWSFGQFGPIATGLIVAAVGIATVWSAYTSGRQPRTV